MIGLLECMSKIIQSGLIFLWETLVDPSECKCHKIFHVCTHFRRVCYHFVCRNDSGSQVNSVENEQRVALHAKLCSRS